MNSAGKTEHLHLAEEHIHEAMSHLYSAERWIDEAMRYTKKVRIVWFYKRLQISIKDEQ